MALNKQDRVKVTPEIEEAMRHWSSTIQAMLDHKYGKENVGHILVIFPYGSDSSPSWIATAKRESVVLMLRHLADHIEKPDARIILPH